MRIKSGWLPFAGRCIGVWQLIQRYMKPYLTSDYCVQVIRLLRCIIIRCSKDNWGTAVCRTARTVV
ncbi:MAG: hypothetical protein LBB73_06030 [Dysgonamonadaceae bacterium]|nr:hypothetical protein [Dysgonamonadaceae bacterium]